MKILKCDICGSDEGIKTYRLPIYRLHDGCDGLTQYGRPIVRLADIDICPECLRRCTNIYDDTVMGYGDISIRQNPELNARKED